MKAASLNEIKKQLDTLDALAMEKICLRLARYRKENKELLTYLLFEAHDEEAYVSNVKIDVDELFETLPRGNVYFIKKSVRKIIRFINKQVRFSGAATTELEVRIYFCLKMRSANVPLNPGTVLYNLYHQQLKKVQAIWSKLPEDLQFDYERDLELIREPTG
jgi:hypothetical protein